MNGRKPSTPSSENMNGLACSVIAATAGIASCETCEPNSLIVWPVQSFRKSRCDQRAPDGLRIGGGGRSAGSRQWMRLEHAALELGLGRRWLLHGLGHLLHLQHGAEGDGEDREHVPDPADPERRPQAEPGCESAAEQRA